jgi:NAD(P)H-flavin reductase
VYTLTEAVPAGWNGEQGAFSLEMIQRHINDYSNALFYISGPEPMVRSFVTMLRKAGIAQKQIKRDYFPGYST